jgi:hypothetical protein
MTAVTIKRVRENSLRVERLDLDGTLNGNVANFVA